MQSQVGRAQLPHMENKKIIRFVESLILLPIATMSSVPMGSITQATVNIVQNSLTSQTVLSEKLNKIEELAERAKAEAIDLYFKSRSMPLAGLGAKMVLEAKKHELDWRLVAAIAVRESTGGKHACKKVENNPFGWGSCKIGFDSVEESIETVARNLGGNNPKTARHYDNKSTIQILRAYNPPSIVPKYAEQEEF